MFREILFGLFWLGGVTTLPGSVLYTPSRASPWTELSCFQKRIVARRIRSIFGDLRLTSHGFGAQCVGGKNVFVPTV